MEPPLYDEITVFTYADNSDEWSWIANGTGVDFTGCVGAFSARVVPDDELPLFSAPVTLGTLATGNLGLVRLDISAAILATIPGTVPPVVHGDILLTMTDGSLVEFAHLDVLIKGGSTYGLAPAPVAREMPLIPPASGLLAYANPIVLVDTTAGNVPLTLPTSPIDGLPLTYKVVAGAHLPVLWSGNATIIVNPENGDATSNTFTPAAPPAAFTLVGSSFTFTWSKLLGKWVS